LEARELIPGSRNPGIPARLPIPKSRDLGVPNPGIFGIKIRNNNVVNENSAHRDANTARAGCSKVRTPPTRPLSQTHIQDRLHYTAPQLASAQCNYTARYSETTRHCIVIAPVSLCLFVCLFVCGSVTMITRNCARIDPHQAVFAGKGSDHLQLIKFWPSRAPKKGVCDGAKMLALPYYSQRAVFASPPSVFFSFNKVLKKLNPETNEM